MKRAYPQFMASRRGPAAARDPDDDLPAAVLGSHQEERRAAQTRSVSRRRADGAGVDVRSRYQIARGRVRPDADDAADRPAVRAQDEAALFAAAPDDRRKRTCASGRCISPTRSASSAACTSRWRATTPVRRRCAAGCAKTPDLPQDEFIDNIPYPETQQYVKRLLGTAEDYRRLYAAN